MRTLEDYTKLAEEASTEFGPAGDRAYQDAFYKLVILSTLKDLLLKNPNFKPSYAKLLTETSYSLGIDVNDILTQEKRPSPSETVSLAIRELIEEDSIRTLPNPEGKSLLFLNLEFPS